ASAVSAARGRASSGFAAMTPDVGPEPAKEPATPRPVPIAGPPTVPSGSPSNASGGGSSAPANGVARPLKPPMLTPAPEGSGADA
ncbi:MAG TPA: hypothetical protein VGC06_14655, partial [Actinomycetes bacterium]